MTPDERPDVLDDEVVDPEIDEERPGHGGEVARRLAVTAGGLALYVFLSRLPLPGVTEAVYELPGAFRRMQVLALGLTPLIISFLLVELFAVLGPGGRLREGGIEGRARLTRIALALGLGMALVQGLSIGRFLSNMVSPAGSSLAEEPGPMFILLTGLTLAAGTAGCWALASAISRSGLGNGFCLLFVLHTVWPGLISLGSLTDLEASPGRVLLPLGVVVVLALTLSRVERTEAEEGGPALPAFPQGILPVLAVVLLLPWIKVLLTLNPQQLTPPAFPPWTETALLLVLVPLLSWVAYLALSGPQRLANELPVPADEAAGITAALRRRLPLSTGVLTLCAAGLSAWAAWNLDSWLPVTFAGTAMLATVLFDLWEEGRFTARHGRTARLLTLDNVYLAHHLARVLEEAGIEALARSYRFRSLFFFFLPLVKIDLLVPAGRLGEARERIAAEELRVV